jgi:ribosome-associated protein
MTEVSAEELVRQIAQRIYDKKGFNILALDVRGISTMTEFFVIAEGTVDRHVKALSGSVLDVLAQFGENSYRVEGAQNADWMVIDCWRVVVHLFGPGLRDRYQLERLWSEGKIVDLQLSES